MFLEGDPGLPCSPSVLPRAKAGRGIDFEPQNRLAAVAGVRDSGVRVVVDTPKNLAGSVIPAAFAGFVIYDLEVGVPIGSIAWFMLADTVQVLIAALGLRYCFDGVPRLNSVLALAKYSFFAVFLAPVAAAFLGASGIGGEYWNGWRICFPLRGASFRYRDASRVELGERRTFMGAQIACLSSRSNHAYCRVGSGRICRFHRLCKN